MPKKYAFTLVSQSLPRRNQSTIRRSLAALGATVHIATPNTEILPPDTTHLLLTEQIACATFVISVAAAADVRLVTPAFAEDCAKYETLTPPPTDSHQPPYDVKPGVMLPASEKALWIGRPWSGAYHFWRARADAGKRRPLYGHRVVVVGQLRPRGAARLLAPSSQIVKDILTAAGAAVLGESDPDPTFAVVAPGLNSDNSSTVARFLNEDVLCLSSAFLVDLIIRVSANPSDYVLFSSQKSLCGSRLDHSSILTLDAPLPIILRPMFVPKPAPVPSPVIIDLCSSSESHGITAADPAACSSSEGFQLNSEEKSSVKKSSEIDSLPRPVSTPPHPSSPSRHVIHKGASQAKRINLNTPTDKKKVSSSTSVFQDTSHSKAACRSSAESQNPSSGSLVARKETLRNGSDVQVGVKRTEPEYSPTRMKRKPSSVKAPTGVFLSARLPRRSSPRFSKSQSRNPNLTSNISVGESGPNEEMQESSACLGRSSNASSDHGTPAKPFSEASQQTETQSFQFVDGGAKPGGDLNRSVCNFLQFSPVRKSPSCAQDVTEIRSVPARIRLKAPKRRSGTNSVQDHDQSMHQQKRPRRNATRSLKSRERVIRKISDSSDVDVNQDDIEQEPAQIKSSRKPHSIACHSTHSFKPQKLDAQKLLMERGEKPLLPLREENNKRCSNSRQSRHSNEIDSDFDSGNISEVPVLRSKCDVRAAEKSQSLRDGYEFILSAIGGEASENSVKRVLRSINAPKEFWEDVHDEPDKSKDVHPLSDPPDCEESQSCDDTNAVAVDTTRDGYIPSQKDIVTNDNLFCRERINAEANGSRSKSTGTNLPSLALPKRPIILSNIVRSELALMSDANRLNVINGNSNDDEACQGTVSFGQWLLAAENLVGFLFLDEAVLTEGNRTLTIRRLWSSLFESTVLERLSSPGGFSESQIIILAGICIRLLSNEPQLDMVSRLARELLKLHEKQKLNGSDSLYTVLTASNADDVSLRHKAVGGIWSALLHTLSQNKDERSPLTFYDEIMKSSIDDLFQYLTVPEKGKRLNIDSKIVSFMDTFRLLLFTSAIKLDIFETEDDMEIDNSARLIPENWSVICNIFERYEKELQQFCSVDISKSFLVAMLENVTRDFCGAIWTVTEKVLLSTSHAVAALCKMEKRSCYCDQSPLYIAHSDVLGQANNSIGIHKSVLTPCDYLMYIGREFVANGEGNGMKRVMTVIRSTALFSNSDGTEIRRTVWHHVGSVLGIASFISQHAGGEDHVLNILTTKGLDLLSMLKQTDKATGDNIETWEILHSAIVSRCECIVKQYGHVHIYVNWLCEGIVECVGLMHRIAKRRTIGTGERETLRVQEGLVRTIMLRRICTLRDIMDIVWRQIDERGTRSDVITMCVAAMVKPAMTFFAFCRESVSQMRLNYEQGSGKSRDLLVCEVLDVLKSLMKLMAHLCGDTTLDVGGVVGEFARRCGPYTLIINEENEGMVVDLIGGQDLIRDEGCSTRAKNSSAVILALMIELRALTNETGWSGENCEKLVALLRKCKLDIISTGSSNVTEFGPGAGTFGREVQGLDDRSMVRFWWWGVRSKWAAGLIEQNQEIKGTVLGVIAWLMVFDRTAGTDEYSLIKEMKRSLQAWNSVNEYVKDWTDTQNDSRVEAEVNNRTCQSVEKILTQLGEQWGRIRARGLIRQLRMKVMGLVRCKRKGAALDGLTLLSTLFKIESDARGFCNGNAARWMLPWITDICDSLQWIAHAGGAWRNGPQWCTACEHVQRGTMGALSMVAGDGRDAELRMLVLRLFNGMDASDNLSGVWDAPSHIQHIRFADNNHVETEVMKRKACRNLDEWRTYAFRSVVDDPLTRHLTGGKSVAFPLKRLLSAARHAASVSSVDGRSDIVGNLTIAVVQRIRNSNWIDAMEREATTRVLWRQVCASVDLISSSTNCFPS